MAALGSLVVDLSADTAKFQSDLGRAAQVAAQSMDRIKGVVGAAARALPALAGAFELASFAVQAKQAVDNIEAIGVAAEKSGIAAEKLSLLRHAAELSNATFEQLAGGIKKFGSNLADAQGGGEEARAAFTALGIQVTDSNGRLRSTEQILLDVADKFAGYADGANKSALAVKLFGKEGDSLIPFLNKGRAGIGELTEQARKLGLQVSGESAKLAGQFNDNIKLLGESAKGTAQAFVNTFLPSLVQITDRMKQGIVEGGKLHGILEGMREAVTKLFETMSGGTKGQMADLTRNIERQLDQIERLQAQPQNALRDRTLKQLTDAVQKNIEERAKLNELLKFETPGGLNAGVTRTTPAAKPDAPAVPKKLGPDSDVERIKERIRDLQIAAQVQEEATEFQKEQAKIAEGYYKKITPEQKAEILRLAAALDIAKADAQLRKEVTQLLEQRAKASADQQRQQADEMNRAAEGVRDMADQLRVLERELVKVNALYEAGLITLFEKEEVERRLYEEGSKRESERVRSQERVNEAAKEGKDWAQELGLTFNSAFEDAIINGRKLSDVLRGLAADFLRIIARKTITEPLANAVAGGVGKVFDGLFGGARAGGGPVMPGRAYLVGEQGPELFVPPGRGAVVANGRYGAAITYAPVIRIDARTDRAQVENAVRAGMAASRAEFVRDLRQGRELQRLVQG